MKFTCDTKQGKDTLEINREGVYGQLNRLVSQRSGIDYRDYDNRADFMKDYRSIVKDGRLARDLINHVFGSRIMFSDELIQQAIQDSGRLRFYRAQTGLTELQYIPGQNYPTEYRNAVAYAMYKAIWYSVAEDTEGDVREAVKAYLKRAGLSRVWKEFN